MKLTELTVHELQEKIKKKEITITQITKAYVDRINEKEKDVQAFITTLTDKAMEQAKRHTRKNGKRRKYRRICRNTNWN